MGMRTPTKAGLVAALALVLTGCGAEKKAESKKPAARKAPAELSWQYRQVRLAEPCRTADLIRQTKVGPAAAPAAPATPTPEPVAAAPLPAPAAPSPTTTAPAETPEAAPPPAAPPDGTPADAVPAPPAPPPVDPNCVRFNAVYPEFEAGMPRALLTRLNDAVEELATSPSFDERRAGSVDGTGRKLIAAWKTRVLEKSGPPERWYDDRKVEVIHRDDQVISLRLEEKLRAGGANELATALYVSYSLDRIDRLSMADLFVEGSAKRLNELGEKKFRELRGIAPSRSLADAGFDFPGGYFRLSSNFAVSGDGLVFRYNPYDVGPFALGATEVVLASEQLKELLRPRGPLGGRLAAPAPAAPVAEPPAAEPPVAEPPAVQPAAEPEAVSREGG